MCRLSYDGGQEGVFNYSDKTLITHELGHSYTDDVVEHGLTLDGKFRSLSNVYRRGKLNMPVSRSTLR